jgi:hypothetical protein
MLYLAAWRPLPLAAASQATLAALVHRTSKVMVHHPGTDLPTLARARALVESEMDAAIDPCVIDILGDLFE